MALRWTGTAMLEAKKTFRSLKAYKHLPVLRTALLRHQQAVLADQADQPAAERASQWVGQTKARMTVSISSRPSWIEAETPGAS